jgi:hypothetical protein
MAAKVSFPKLLVLACSMLLMASCAQEYSATEEEAVDSIGPPEIIQAEKTALLGYTYPIALRIGEIGDVNAYIEIENPNSTIHEKLVRIVSKQRRDQSAKGDSIIVFEEKIPFYQDITISLNDVANDFKIEQAHDSDKQTIDTINGNKWHWIIIPQTDRKTAQLILNVKANTPEGVVKGYEPKRIFIDVKMDHNSGIRGTITYLWKTPTVSIPILVSLFGFFGFLIKNRIAKKNKAES